MKRDESLVGQQTSKSAQVKPRETNSWDQNLSWALWPKPAWPVLEIGLTGLGTDTVQRLVGLKTGLTSFVWQTNG
jgi:hypothetical protein